MRTMTIRQSAWLAVRSPPRLSRLRMVSPEEASMGGDAAVMGKRRLAAQALGIVAGGDHERAIRDGDPLTSDRPLAPSDRRWAGI